jgi:hypothetical protein
MSNAPENPRSRSWSRRVRAGRSAACRNAAVTTGASFRASPSLRRTGRNEGREKTGRCDRQHLVARAVAILCRPACAVAAAFNRQSLKNGERSRAGRRAAEMRENIVFPTLVAAGRSAVAPSAQRPRMVNQWGEERPVHGAASDRIDGSARAHCQAWDGAVARPRPASRLQDDKMPTGLPPSFMIAREQPRHG